MNHARRFFFVIRSLSSLPGWAMRVNPAERLSCRLHQVGIVRCLGSLQYGHSDGIADQSKRSGCLASNVFGCIFT
jgi:hypothetical protein